MPELLTCDVCGAGFHARSDAVYCSPGCRQKAHRARAARRIADLAGSVGPIAGSRRALVNPDVADTIRRAKHEQRRARELCRTAADTLRKTLASQPRGPESQLLTRAMGAIDIASTRRG